MALTALSTLEQELAKRLGGYAAGATNVGSANLTDLIDTSQDSPFNVNDTQNRFRNAWLMITSGSANNDLVTVGTYNVGTGIVGARNFTATLASGVSYELYTILPPTYFGLAEGLDECINFSLRALEDWRLIPLSLIQDGDMSASGVANWAAGAGGTRVKVQATYGVMEASQGVWSGRQSLYVNNAGAGDQILGQYNQLQWGSTYILDFIAKSIPGDTLGFHVEDNSAGGPVTFTNTAGSIAPDTFYQYEVQFSTLAAPATGQDQARVIWERYGSAQSRGYIDHVQLCRTDQNRYALPDWVIAKSQITEVFRMYNTNGPADRLRLEPLSHWDCIVDPQGGSPMTLLVGPQVGGSLDDVGKNLWINARAPAYELKQRSDVTPLDKDLILAGAAARAYEFLTRQASGDDRKRFRELQRMSMIEFLRRRKSMQNKPAWKTQTAGGWIGVF